ncbi:TPA: hypothetical protein JBD08_09290 [Legionella pneumophila subsp. pneumophila]|nr:hypothetical protein D7226_06020 [Legionella pneumophila]HAT8682675.1 hypothetical protein [Legionella pneumophila subsp. pneumophila ATCC 43283]HAT8879657.1 hypothetical protein [Legionella pneumophila subsp. pneumophila]HAT6337935.1 hypothetical protein [Legionella pneumophila]HAT6376081.1 hypothetical protein [Legionella pneumophila]
MENIDFIKNFDLFNLTSKFIPVNAYFFISPKYYCFYYLLKNLTKFYTTYIKSPIFLKENEISW